MSALNLYYSAVKSFCSLLSMNLQYLTSCCRLHLHMQSGFMSLVQRFRGPTYHHRNSYSSVNFWAHISFQVRCHEPYCLRDDCRLLQKPSIICLSKMCYTVDNRFFIIEQVPIVFPCNPIQLYDITYFDQCKYYVFSRNFQWNFDLI